MCLVVILSIKHLDLDRESNLDLDLDLRLRCVADRASECDRGR